MSIVDLLIILRERWKILAATVLAITGLAVGVMLLLGPSYRATTSVVVDYARPDAVSGNSAPQLQQAAVVATQADIIRSFGTALKVVDRLKMDQDPAILAMYRDEKKPNVGVREWAALRLLKKLDVVPAKESSVIDISFKARTADEARAVANAIVTEYELINIQIKENPLQQASTYFDRQLEALRDNLEAAQNRLSQYQQEKGIVVLENRLDVESKRLNDLSTELVSAQNRMSAALAHQMNAEGRDGRDSPQVSSNPLIQTIKASLVKAEATLSQVSNDYSDEHPRYQQAKAEVDKLRSALEANIRAVLRSVRNDALIARQHEADLRRSLAEQRDRVLELNRSRDKLSILEKDAESARVVYDNALQRYYQTRLAGHANQADIFVLNARTPSVRNATPPLAVVIAFSMVIGALLGTGLCLLAEMIDPRIRSSRDVLRILDEVPLLAEIAVPIPEQRLLLLK